MLENNQINTVDQLSKDLDDMVSGDNYVVDVDVKIDDNNTCDNNSKKTDHEYDSGQKPKVSRFQKRKRVKKIVSKILSAVVWIVGICLLYLCLSNLYQQIYNPDGYTGFFGVGEAVVSSNSMKPQLHPNDLIFYRSTGAENVNVGDVIVYEKTDSSGDKMLIVHKVEKIDNEYITTKGINNQVPDEPIKSSAVIGKYMFKIGKAGFLLNLLSTKWAPIVIISALLAVFVLRIAMYFVHKKKVIENISPDDRTRDALTHFFDI